jgi:GT2 family glycosyltransferase
VRVSVSLVTWNSADVLPRCLDALRRQTLPPAKLLIVDNGSRDDTRRILDQVTNPDERILLDVNTGFSAAHNLAIERTGAPYHLTLNPDVFLTPAFLERLVRALDADPCAGSASGKLLRADGSGTIDSAGIRMLPAQRHVDRGAGELDRGQYDRPCYVFGVSGAAALYRRTMLEDVRVCGEVFDEDFFAYREDADLAWRAQLLGWRCVYTPDAVAHHVRRVTPERRAELPPALNRYSVRNRFLLRLKNQTCREAIAFLGPALARDLQVAGYVCLREHGSIAAFFDVLHLLPRTLRKRRAIMRRRRVPAREMIRWFRQDHEDQPGLGAGR